MSTPASNPVNVDGGASGSGGSFSLSTGGLVAIIVVIVVVVILGTGVTVLYFLAKRRQWKLRESLARASRRLRERKAGRNGTSRRPSRSGAVNLDKQSKRAGMQGGAEPSKAGTREVVTEMSDLEKGLPDGKAYNASRTDTTRTQSLGSERN